MLAIFYMQYKAKAKMSKKKDTGKDSYWSQVWGSKQEYENNGSDYLYIQLENRIFKSTKRWIISYF